MVNGITNRLNGLNNKVRFNAVLDIVFDDTSITEPVTLAEAKAWAKIDTTADDSIITSLITTARQQCEDYVGISLVGHTIKAVLNNSNGGIFLPYGPVVEISSVKDEDGNAITDYETSGTNFVQLLYPTLERITVEYTTGYDSLPGELKTAILQQFFYIYHNRGEIIDFNRQGDFAALSQQAKATLQRLRR